MATQAGLEGGPLEHYPVSKDVGKVSNDGEYLLELDSE
jgi:hypothetical protein